MKLWITRTSKESCMVTTMHPVIVPVVGSSREKAFVPYGDPIGAKNLCMLGILALMPNLRLEINESKRIEIKAEVVE